MYYRLFKISILLAISPMVFYLAGCSKNSDSQPKTDTNQGSCPSAANGGGLQSLPSSCCNSSGIQVSFTGQCASTNNATDPATNGAVNNGAAAANSGQTALNASGALGQGNAGNTKTGGLQTAAALGGDVARSLLPPNGSGSQPQALANLNRNDQSGGGSGGGGGGAGDSGGLKLGSGDTAPMGSEASPTPAGASGDQGALYSGGGGGAGANQNGKSDPMASLLAGFRGPAGEGGSVGSASVDLRAGAGNGTSTLGTADPQDYFTRVDLKDSLFKVVEKRYRQKATSWALIGIRHN